ncbi:MAG: hypothetical protein K8R48_03285 [Alphaproteobacteria bacterium]|nr:hypothetical protein [Alphaproteobacteria bacterium]
MSMRNLFNKLVLGAALVTSVGAMQSCSNDTTDPYSEGDRVGTVTKLSYKGFFNKSWEGELAMDNFKSSGEDGSTSNSFEFTVKDADTALVRQLQEAQENGDRVKLHYKEVWNHRPRFADTDYFITKVTKATAPQSPAPVLLKK